MSYLHARAVLPVAALLAAASGFGQTALGQTTPGQTTSPPPTSTPAAPATATTPAPSAQGFDAETMLDPISVTATPGNPQRVRDVQATVEVLGPDQVNAVPPTSTQRILQQAQGVLPIDNGSTSSITIRGFQPGQALILVDGQRRRGRFGFQDLTNIDPSIIERIEVVRGPMSALYGADAVAGVVNIITKRPAETMGASIEAMGGGMPILRSGERGNRQTGRLTMSADTGRIDLGMDASVRSRISLSGLNRESWSSGSSLWDDLRPFERRLATWVGVWDMTPGHSMEARFEWQRQNDSGTGSNGAVRPLPTIAYERQEDFYGAATYAGDFGDFGSVRATFSSYSSSSETRRANFVNTTDILGQEINAYWNLLLLEAHQVTVGFNAVNETINLNSIVTGEKGRTSYGFVAQDQWRFAEDWSLLAGIRYDQFSDFGDSVNPRASLQWTPGPWTFRIGVGTAFRAPNFQELYTVTLRGRSAIFGNPRLRPESSTTYEATIGRRFGETTDVSLTYYRADVQDLITFVQTGATRFDYRNVNQARIQGTEVGLNSMLTDTLILRSSFDWNDAVDARTGARLTQRARYTFRFGLDWKATESTNVNVFWRALFDYYGGSLQNPNANAINSNYNRLDIRVDQRIVPGVTMYAGVDGILGSPVPYTMAPIEPPGPFVYAGVRMKF